MDEHRRSTKTTLVGLLVAGLFIIGFAAITSKPFQENVLNAPISEEVVSEATGASGEPTEEAPAKEAVEQTADAADAARSNTAETSPGEVVDDALPESQSEPPTAEEEAAKAKADKAAAEAEAAKAEAEAEGAKEEAAAASENLCCEPGDTTPPLELVKQVPPGGLHNPYDWKKLKEEHADDPDYLVKQFRLPGCNECHGGGGGGGFCPALSQGVWFWGNTDDVLFRLIVMGSKALEEQGFERIQWGTVKAPMPEMGHVIKTSDHVWKIVSFLRSINPPGTNPPEKVIPGRYTPPEKNKAE